MTSMLIVTAGGGLRRRRLSVGTGDGAVMFDGATYANSGGADLTGNADGKVGTLAVWIHTPVSWPGANVRIFASQGERFTLSLGSTGQLFVLALDGTGATALNLRSTPLSLDTTHRALFSWDVTGADTVLAQVYIDDVSAKGAGNTIADLTIDYTRTGWALGATTAGAQAFTGTIADLWVSLTTRLDFSNEVNRRKFFTAGGCIVPKGSAGAGPGVTPIAFFSDTDPAQFHVNKGTGGGFSMVAGTLTAASVQPCWGAPSALQLDQISGAVVDATTQYNPPSTPTKPAYLGSYNDATFGTLVTRITGDPGTGIPNTSKSWGAVARAGYFKTPVWNADMSLMSLPIVTNVNNNLILDGETYVVQYERVVQGEVRWHPSLPAIMVEVGNSQVRHYDVAANSRVTMVQVEAGYSSTGLSNEGTLSADGNRVAMTAIRNSDGANVVIPIEISSNTRFPDINLDALGVISLDYATISPSGNYVIVVGRIPDAIPSGSGNWDSTMIIDLEGNTAGPSWLEYGRPSHADFGFDQAGNEVGVGNQKTGGSAQGEGKVLMRRLLDGVITYVNAGGYSYHHGNRNVALPGWSFVNHWGWSASWPPYRDEIHACKLDDSVTVVRICHMFHGLDGDGYRVVPSPDGLRVVFSSRWGGMSAGDPIQSYVADLRPLI